MFSEEAAQEFRARVERIAYEAGRAVAAFSVDADLWILELTAAPHPDGDIAGVLAELEQGLLWRMGADNELSEQGTVLPGEMMAVIDIYRPAFLEGLRDQAQERRSRH